MSKPVKSFPVYADLPAVSAALGRLADDLTDLRSEALEAVNAVSWAMQAPGDREEARRALTNIQAQLVWLAADAGAMLAVLADEEEEYPMPGPMRSPRTVPSPVTHLYYLAESLLHLGKTLPEDQGGLAMLLCLLGGEVDACAARLDDEKGDAEDGE